MKTISLRLPEPLHAKLERLATVRQQSKSDVVRVALERMLNGASPTKRVSARELAGELVGSCEGPGDLSTNPRYLDGFGK